MPVPVPSNQGIKQDEQVNALREPIRDASEESTEPSRRFWANLRRAHDLCSIESCSGQHAAPDRVAHPYEGFDWHRRVPEQIIVEPGDVEKQRIRVSER